MSVKRGNKSAHLIAAFVMLLACTIMKAEATNYTWDNGAGTYRWSNPTNWNPDGLPGPADTVTMGSANTTVDTAIVIGTLNHNAANNINSMAGGSLSLTNLVRTGGGYPVIQAPITLATNLTVSGDSSEYFDALVSGPGKIISSASRLGLRGGANTFTGGLDINAGYFFFYNGGWGGGPITLGSGANNCTLYFPGGGDYSLCTNPVTVAVGSGQRAFYSQNNNASFTIPAQFILNRDFEADACHDGTAMYGNNTVYMNGLVSGTGAVTKTVNITSTVRLGNYGSTYSGKTRATKGTLAFFTMANLGTASSLGAPTNEANGTIELGTAGQSSYARLYLWPGQPGGTSDRLIRLFGTATATNVLDASGAGAWTLDNGISCSVTGANVNLTLQGTGQGTIRSPVMLGTGKVIKEGTGSWQLSGTNSYSDITAINGGSLAGNFGVGIPAASRIVFGGGVLEGLGTVAFTNSLGTASQQVQWGASSNGGFSANGGVMTVNLNNDLSQLTWNSTPNFVSNAVLKFGSITADNLTDFQNPIELNSGIRTVQVDKATYSTTDSARLSGTISGDASSGLTKTGAGVLQLTGTNTYGGATTVAGGMLRATLGTGIPSSSALILSGGMFENVNGGDFTNALGTGGGQFVWGNNGGFSANGGPLTINVNNDLSTLIWNSTPNFLANNQAMQMGSITADSLVDLKNPVDLNGAIRTVTVTDNPNATGDWIRLSGALSGAGASGLIKTGSGLLELAGINTYTNVTVISNGVLRATPGTGLPANSPLQFAGGVLEGLGTVAFSRTVGTGLGQVNWLTNGGFSANGGVMTVSLSGGATMTWASTVGFVSNAVLRFGSSWADDVADFRNPINLNGAARTIQVDDNPNVTTDVARLSGALSGTGSSGLTKTGSGVLELTGTNVYAGATTVSAGTLNLNGVQSNANITVAAGARLGGTGTIVFTPGKVMTINGTNDATALAFDLTGLTYTNTPITLVNYGSGAFIGPARLNDLLTAASAVQGWALIDTGTGILAILQPPLVSNATGATALSNSSAVVNGMVISTGAAPTTVFVAWGSTDGDTNASNWDHVVTLGDCSGPIPEAFSNKLLRIRGTYYYRFFATNVYGTGWATQTTSFVTFPPNLIYRMKVAFPGYSRSEPLTNFPALVKFSETLTNFLYRTFVTTNGLDLRFVDSTETTLLNYEIEQWNTNGTSYVWVQVPMISNDSAYVWACWGDTAYSNRLPCTTNGSTWRADFKAVWHMNQTNALDSTANKRHGTAVGGVTSVNGQIAQGDAVNGIVGSYIGASPFAAGDTNTFTMSFWCRPLSTHEIDAENASSTLGTTGQRYALTPVAGGGYDGSQGHAGAGVSVGTNGISVYEHAASYMPATLVWTGPVTNWTQIAVVYLNSQPRLYVNGNLMRTGVTSGRNYVHPSYHIGGSIYGCLTGWVDEVRVSNTTQSSNWLWACYMNQASNQTFSVYEPVLPPVISVGTVFRLR